MKPILTIAIPTYSRAELLRKALTAIGEQCTEEISEKLEVVISDNASIDHTGEVVREIRAKYPRLSIVHLVNETNIGGPPNLARCFDLGTGEYLFLHSDDDFFLPGALQQLIEALAEKTNSPDYLAINTAGFFPGADKVLSPAYDERRFDHRTTAFNRPEEALEFLSTLISFISIIAFRRSLINIRAERYAVTAFPHSYIFVQVISRATLGKFITKPILATRGDSAVGYDFYDVFVREFNDVLNYAASLGIDKIAVAKISANHSLRFLLRFTLVFKKSSSYGGLIPNWSNARKVIRKYYWTSVSGLLFSIPVYVTTFIPQKICSKAIDIYKRVRLLKRLST